MQSFFVSNTIQLVIYSKKNDILTYQLLGATKSFIKIPYLIEGMLHGLFGAFISIMLLLLLYNFIDYYLSTVLILRNLNFNEIIFLNVILGMFLGFLGSSKALSYTLKININNRECYMSKKNNSKKKKN